MKRLSYLTFLLLLVSVAWAHAFSREALEQIDRSVTFIELQQTPDNFIGRDLLLGGTIITLEKRRGGGMQMEVAQLPLTASNRPAPGFKPQGRFLATIPDELDRDEYRPGMRIALIGTVKKGATVVLEGEETVYPVLAVKEMELWPAGIAERIIPPSDVVILEREPERVYIYDDYRYPAYWPYYSWPLFPFWFGASISIHDHPVHHYRPHRDRFAPGIRDGIRGGGSPPPRPPRRGR